MRRTHVMHKRDNRRGYHYAQHNHRDERPTLGWRIEGDFQFMELDGCPVASVYPVGEPIWVSFETGHRQAHEAQITDGPRTGEIKLCEDLDAARLFCEAAFAGKGAS